MSIHSCIFCKIIAQQIPSQPLIETELTLVIADINPQAPIHYLVMPKKHIEHMGCLEVADTVYIADMALVVQQLSKKLVQPTAFNVIINNGVDAGQSVPHLHWHFLAGKNLYTNGFQL